MRRIYRVLEIARFVSFDSGGNLTRRASAPAKPKAHGKFDAKALDAVEAGDEDADVDEEGMCVCWATSSASLCAR